MVIIIIIIIIIIINGDYVSVVFIANPVFKLHKKRISYNFHIVYPRWCIKSQMYKL
jgi:hypothetical protein